MRSVKRKLNNNLRSLWLLLSRNSTAPIIIKQSVFKYTIKSCGIFHHYLAMDAKAQRALLILEEEEEEKFQIDLWINSKIIIADQVNGLITLNKMNAQQPHENRPIKFEMKNQNHNFEINFFLSEFIEIIFFFFFFQFVLSARSYVTREKINKQRRETESPIDTECLHIWLWNLAVYCCWLALVILKNNNDCTLTRFALSSSRS